MNDERLGALLTLLSTIVSKVLCSSAEDEPRYCELLRGWIADGILPDFPDFTKETEKKRRRRRQVYEREANEAKKMKMDNDGESSECVHT